MALPDCIDVRLWIEIGGIDGRCYLFGNCGTSLGRMYAFSETLDTSLCVSKHEIVSQSDESAYWIDGFLHGTARFGDAMFGPRYDEELDDLEPRWIAARKEFIRSGDWPAYGDPRLPPAFPPLLQLPVTPWCLRVDEVWVWTGNEWSKMDPQPSTPLVYEPFGPRCEDEGHESEMVTTCHDVCLRCGRTDVEKPEGISWEDWESARPTFVAQAVT